ncbi:MAG: methylated-DNA--[protein]-cysteine S-methyltransferase [Candidatus Eremiobacteraeota bacterium]|nr:methylated-DNA--[protein]-cysteine S-methyltransferase [Candidatus Eremiobacteraeota bacterium]
MLEHAPCSVPERIREVCRFIEDHSDDSLTLDDLARRAAMSRFHFARSFKAVVGVTPKQYLGETRMKQLKSSLQAAKPIDAAVYDAGYGSASRVYEQASTRLGMTPAQYRAAGAGVCISYATLESPVGLVMIGATDRGVCFVQLGDDAGTLRNALRAEYSNASIEPMRRPYHPEFRRWVDALAAYLTGEQPHLDLPLDIRATAFQMRVWRYVQSIPYGSVASYGEVAAGVGAPHAARAVARACGDNTVALVIPCHRVIRGNGELGGYRWGLPRKRALLDRERARKQIHAAARS